jgi:hypothetical protein
MVLIHGFPSTTALVSAEISDRGASASMLITLRSFPVITIRPIEADDSSFRILGRNAILFVALGGKRQIAPLHPGPSQLELAWPWLSFLWKSDLPECPDDFSSSSQQKTYSISQVPEPRYWGLTSPGGSPLCTSESLGDWLDE